MAKPINELLTELQVAVEKSDKNQAALTTLRDAENKKIAAAQAAYDAAVAKSRGAIDTAQAQTLEAEAYVKTLQDEVNKVLGLRATENSRVRVG